MTIRIRTLVLIWLCALAAIAYFQRSLGVAESTVRAQLHLTKADMGILQSSFFWSYALFQVPTAWLVHRWGPRFGLAAFCLTWSLATGLTGLSSSLWILCAARIVAGFGQAAALPGIAEVLSQWFPQSSRGRATAAIAASMQVGAALNAKYTGELLEHLALDGFFWALAIPGFLWAVGFYLWYREDPRAFTRLSAVEMSELPVPPDQIKGAGAFSWWRLLSSPVLWFICGQQFCRAAGYIFFATWFATYLQEAQHYGVKESGTATSWTFGGVLVGALAGGALSDWILQCTGSKRWARQGVAIGSLLACAACIAGSFATSQHWILSMSLMTLGAFFSGVGGSAGYTVTMDVSGKSVALVFGFMNTAGNIGAALFPLVIPWCLGPTKDQWDAVIWAFAGLYVAAGVFWMLLNPNQTVFDQTPDTPNRDTPTEGVPAAR